MTTYKPLESDVKPAQILDATGIYSPLPLLRLKKELTQLQSEEIIQLDSTDPNTGDDLVSWCSKSKNVYLGEKRSSSFSSFFVKKK